MNKVEVGSIWRHFKGFELKVLAIAKHTEILEELVIYEHDSSLWARPISMFTNPDNVRNRSDNVTGQTYRFEQVEENV